MSVVICTGDACHNFIFSSEVPQNFVSPSTKNFETFTSCFSLYMFCFDYYVIQRPLRNFSLDGCQWARHWTSV